MDKSKAQKLLALKKTVDACTACILHNSGCTQKVFGAGNADSSLFLIGEGPGVNEDRTGKPFVGKAGKLLDTILLEDLGLQRKDVYVSNIILCRAPHNRTPYPAEAQACLPFLKEQIRIVGPKLIVCLGLPAAVHLLGLRYDSTVKSLRSRILSYGSTPAIVTYHPAAVLRNRERFRDLVAADLKQILPDLGEITSTTPL